jgi:hypothetical protein
VEQGLIDPPIRINGRKYYRDRAEARVEEASAEKRKTDAAAAEAIETEATPAPDDGSIPEYLRRAPEAGAAL